LLLFPALRFVVAGSSPGDDTGQVIPATEVGVKGDEPVADHRFG
jgi:hypothetical protein